MGGYRELFTASINDPETFWAQAAQAVSWLRPPQRVFDDSHPPVYRWFPDATLNTCANALDRHVADGRAEQAALIYDSPVTGVKRTYTYGELLDQTARFASALRALGVAKGDRVLLYLPMIPEAVIAMLACARLGAVHSVVFGGFAANELATRIDDAQPTVVVTASCGIEPAGLVEYKPMLDAAIESARHKPRSCVVVQRDQHRCELTAGRDVEWHAVMADSEPADPVSVAATDPLYVLYTSGTTGKPKGIVRDNGGHAVALLWSMRHIYDIQPGEVFWAASDVGWVVGHSYIVYGPLLLGATTLLYEGKPVGTPDPGAYWRVASEHRVKALFTAPTAIRAIRKEDPDGAHLNKYDLSALRYLFQAGERLDPDTYAWASDKLGIPVIDHWWQTETGWAIAANPLGVEHFPIKPGSPTLPMPGYEVCVLRADGTRCDAGEEGAICIRLPLPPGALPTLWGDDARFENSYLREHPGYYLTGDGGYLDEDGYLYVLGRTDDVINVSGHRLSTGPIEALVAAHPAVAECAVIGVPDDIKGQVPRALVVLKRGASADGLAEDLIATVRNEIGAVACFKQVDVVPALPKTRSGKILRKTMRDISQGKDGPLPSTIEDPKVLQLIRPILQV
jgi:propionyl-CoA synthetase